MGEKLREDGYYWIDNVSSVKTGGFIGYYTTCKRL